MKKQDRQIVWHRRNGYYKNQILFFVIEDEKFYLYLLANGREVEIMDYTTLKDAKRGAERFLRRLQEAVK